ncbi:MAG: VTC domain-containing protein [Verrucomicrobium sp.]|nr:VTC domain-containing protein [Verrucomicrobium sp.]
MIKFAKRLLRPALPAAGEQELKFLVPNRQAAAFRSWLDIHFLPHPSHKDSTVCSIYFDTPDFASYDEKAASDYFKTKYRIRWYADERGHPLPVPAYIEIKEKDGVARRKRRVRLSHSPAELAAMPLTSEVFAGIFHRHFPDLEGSSTANLRPVLELRYQRQRYLHGVYSETFCLDTHIRCVRSHDGSTRQSVGQVLPHEVFEQKGQAIHPLPVLQPLPRFGIRRAAISKYFLILQQLSAEIDQP